MGIGIASLNAGTAATNSVVVTTFPTTIGNTFIKRATEHLTSPGLLFVEIDALATGPFATSNGTLQDSATLTISTRANRALIAEIAFGDNPGTVTVTWDQGASNQALTQIINQTGSAGTNRVQLWGLVNPISGNKTLRITTTNAVGIVSFPISFINADQTGGATTFPGALGSTGTSTAPSLTLTPTPDQWGVSVVGSGTGTFSAPSQTQDFLYVFVPSVKAAGQDATGVRATHSWTLSVSTSWEMAGCCVKPTLAADIFPSNMTPGSNIAWRFN